MRKPAHIFLALLAAMIGGVLLFSPPLGAQGSPSLLCPNGQTVFVEGQAIPREALLLYMRGRPVGGGLAGADGRYSLPLRAQERPGIYPVEVRLRSSRSLVASYTCYVDVPLDAVLTPTDGPDAAPIATPRAAPTAGGPTVAPSRTVAPTRTPAPTSTTGSGGATARPTTATSTTATTATSTTATSTTATSTTTTPVADSPVEINDIVLRDPAFPNESEEYVQIRNRSDQDVNIGGWRLTNASRSGQTPAYVFPNFTLEVDVTIAVFSAIGDDDLEVGDFYWDQTGDVWQVGDRAELRNAQGQLVATLIVPAQN